MPARAALRELFTGSDAAKLTLSSRCFVSNNSPRMPCRSALK
jgi:hypothetical protein